VNIMMHKSEYNETKEEINRGEEQSRMRERLRTDYSLAEFLEYDIANNDWQDITEKLVLSIISWINKLKTERKTGWRSSFSIALDITSFLEEMMGEKDLHNFKEEKIEEAIFNNYFNLED